MHFKNLIPRVMATFVGLLIVASYAGATVTPNDAVDPLGPDQSGSSMNIPVTGESEPQAPRIECSYLDTGIRSDAHNPCLDAPSLPEEPEAPPSYASCMPTRSEIRSSTAQASLGACTSTVRNRCPSWGRLQTEEACIAMVQELCGISFINSSSGMPGCNQSPFNIAAVPPIPTSPVQDDESDEDGPNFSGGQPRCDVDNPCGGDPDDTADNPGDDPSNQGEPQQDEDQASGGDGEGPGQEGPGSPGSPGGNPSQSIQQSADLLAQVCLESFADANQCCNSPLSCMGVDQGSQNDLAGLAGIGGTAMAGQVNSGNTQSIQQACEMMRVAGYSSTGLNSAGAYMCSESKNGCLDTCEASKADLVRMIQTECGYNPDQTRGSCPGVQSAYDLVTSRQLSCMSFSANVAAMGKQAAHSHSSAQMAALCEEQSRTQLAGSGYETPAQDFTAVDCSDPSNQYDARCRDCSNPTMANSALCKGSGGSGYVTGGEVSKTSDTNAPIDMSSRSDFGSRPSGGGFGSEVPTVNQQTAQFDQGLGGQQTASSNGVPNNGGSFVGGSGAAGFGAGGQGPNRGASGGGYNTDVLRGLSGGSGYSNPVGRQRKPAGRGGFRLPTQARQAQKQGIKFDLKKFLPGGSQDPNHRLAGMAGTASSEIGPSHVDIWLRMSNRVKEICRLNRLYDCGKRN